MFWTLNIGKCWFLDSGENFKLIWGKWAENGSFYTLTPLTITHDPIFLSKCHIRFVLCRFMVLQVFLTHTPSSFYRVGHPAQGGVIHPQVLEPSVIGASAIIYTFTSPLLYVIITGLNRYTDFQLLDTWVRALTLLAGLVRRGVMDWSMVLLSCMVSIEKWWYNGGFFLVFFLFIDLFFL